MTSAVGEVEFGWNATELVGLAGMRQHFIRNSNGDFYGQFLLGFTTRDLRGCGLCEQLVKQFGLGGNVALNDRWAVRIRADLQFGGGLGDLPLPTFGAGVTRTWR